MTERKYNVYMNGEIVDRNVTKQEAEALVDEYIDADEAADEDEENFYSIKPVN